MSLPNCSRATCGDRECESTNVPDDFTSTARKFLLKAVFRLCDKRGVQFDNADESMEKYFKSERFVEILQEGLFSSEHSQLRRELWANRCSLLGHEPFVPLELDDGDPTTPPAGQDAHGTADCGSCATSSDKSLPAARPVTGIVMYKRGTKRVKGLTVKDCQETMSFIRQKAARGVGYGESNIGDDISIDWKRRPGETRGHTHEHGSRHRSSMFRVMSNGDLTSDVVLGTIARADSMAARGDAEHVRRD